MAAKTQHVQMISKAICRDDPHMEDAIEVLISVCREAATRAKSRAKVKAYNEIQDKLVGVAEYASTALYEAEEAELTERLTDDG